MLKIYCEHCRQTPRIGTPFISDHKIIADEDNCNMITKYTAAVTITAVCPYCGAILKEVRTSPIFLTNIENLALSTYREENG